MTSSTSLHPHHLSIIIFSKFIIFVIVVVVVIIIVIVNIIDPSSHIIASAFSL